MGAQLELIQTNRTGEAKVKTGQETQNKTESTINTETNTKMLGQDRNRHEEKAD